ncbi:peroxisomal multifunctional enzyme type 2 isoform X3 [Plutella xylostella]|uniref:peroxisomal multifunctional enzyme type 2 isoform X2 n=1 Tax=Plutella xylostella TaxID=51655 RepID=UPI002032C8FA|nr:peroxisomal multifunctional enzyme type 2 isoform X2 [Plutella xylostella]XP_048483713.1 peroxisomal multifunctional enzyme type 2 isoform X3 [Plutella xylostella]
MDQLRFDGRVAVVTGAGGGLGKAYALLLGSRGAKVVVNDLGGARDGAGKSANFADAVVKEIQDKGGVAVADYNSVVEGEKIIKTALDNFGRIDILINNAGILRDRSFAKISEQDWDLIQAVHVKGAFKTTQAAWETFKKQKYGRVVMTSSNAGLFGNFGQANYSAAKMGLVGLMNTLSIEGAKYNVKVNTIVPTAASRLTEDILPPEMFDAMKPDLIAPVVAYMVHESFPDSGNIIDSTLGFATKTHLVRGDGAPLRSKPSDPVTIESVKQHWADAVNMTGAKHVEKLTDVTLDLVQKLQDFDERVKLDAKVGRESYWTTYNYNAKDLFTYALGVGASVRNPTDLRFLYESHEQFAALPTFFILAGMCLQAPVLPAAMPPGKHADFTNILHGEQYLEFVGDYPGTDGEFTTRTYVADVLDKGTAAIGIVNSEVYQDRQLVYRTQQHIFVVGQGGFGGPRASAAAVPVQPVPKRKPDAVVEQTTAEDQAAIYRLSGDLNPLHIDPSVAGAMGHPKPILHGLSSLGFSARHVLAKYGGNDPQNVRAVKARFNKTVLPGQTLVTEMWLEGKRVHFQTKIKENGNVAIGGAYVDLKNVVTSGTAAPAAEPVSSGASLKSDAIFKKIQDAIKDNPAKAKAINAVYQYNITENGKTVKQWTLDLKTPAAYEGAPKSGKADTTMTVGDSVLVDIAAGTLKPQVAYLNGKLKISGNLMLAQKLGPLLQSESKL